MLLSSPPPLLCFRLSQLLSFYLRTMEPLLGAGSRLCEALRACRAMAARTLGEQLRQRGDKLLRYPPPPPRDLSPPQQVVEGAQLLRELVAGWEQSLDVAGGGGAAAEAAAQEFGAVLAAVVGPLQEACLRASEALNPRAATRWVRPASQPPALLPRATCPAAMPNLHAGAEWATACGRRLTPALSCRFGHAPPPPRPCPTLPAASTRAATLTPATSASLSSTACWRWRRRWQGTPVR